MCISNIDKKVQDYRSLKSLLDETQAELDAIKNDIIEYMKENEKEVEITTDGKVTYKDSSRSSFDEKALKEALKKDDLKPFKKTSSYKVLRIS